MAKEKGTYLLIKLSEGELGSYLSGLMEGDGSI